MLRGISEDHADVQRDLVMRRAAIEALIPDRVILDRDPEANALLWRAELDAAAEHRARILAEPDARQDERTDQFSRGEVALSEERGAAGKVRPRDERFPLRTRRDPRLPEVHKHTAAERRELLTVRVAGDAAERDAADVLSGRGVNAGDEDEGGDQGESVKPHDNLYATRRGEALEGLNQGSA